MSAAGFLASAAAAVASRLPALPASAAVAAGFNVAFGEGRTAGLEPLHGRVVMMRVTDLRVSLRLAVTPGGFVACAAAGKADVTVSASSLDFARLALRRVDPDTLFFGRRLVIEGDTELGLLLKNRLDALDLRALAKSPPRPGAVLAAIGAALPSFRSR